MVVDLTINLAASLILLGLGYIVGKYRERGLAAGKNLEEYSFYPFGLDDRQHLHFDLDKFVQAVRFFSRYRNPLAAKQLILLGRQNDVENVLPNEARTAYRKLYRRYQGDQVLSDAAAYLENYKRIVRLIGDSFPDAGIEILLHDLTNPAKALCYIKNTVTGRNIESPATNLVLDLKTRRLRNQDKLNYELNIGARKFKCTTIPIYRGGYGLIGAICINVDVNYLNECARAGPESIEAFIACLCKTDMVLDENILSKDEYERSLAGKRHFRDFRPSTT